MSSKLEVTTKDEMVINGCDSETYTLVLKNSVNNIRYELENGDFHILVFNDYDDDVEYNDFGYIKNGSLEINYIDLNSHSLKQRTLINAYKGTSITINATYLGSNKKAVIYDLYNKESDSVINISNNIVCLDDGDFSIENIGNIDNGAKRSIHHQKTRCLTMGDPKKARVLPVLNINENDVEASHSLSSGTIDEDVLFYMNSRGLTKNESLQLLLVSYLMPSEDFYNDFPDGALIKDLAEKKVEKACLM